MSRSLVRSHTPDGSEAVLPMEFPSTRAQDPIRPNDMGIFRASKISVDKTYEARQSFVHFSSGISQYDTSARGSFVHGLASGNAMHSLMTSGWYESSVAIQLRRLLQSRTFTVIKVAALTAALFCSELMVLFQIPGNLEADYILTFALMTFMLDLLGNTLVEVSYPLSIFFWCDVVGNLSMFFDISYLMGGNATEARRIEDEPAVGDTIFQSQLLLLSTPAARLCTRAGRLSRIFKILPILQEFFLDSKDDSTKMAKAIANKLSDALCLRITLLTLCFALVLPEIKLFGYPQTDESMLAFTAQIAIDAQELLDASQHKHSKRLAVAQRQLTAVLTHMSDFYSSQVYGPYKVCYGHDAGSHFNCMPEVLDIRYDSDTYHEPRRLNSCWEVSSNNVQVFFDMSRPMQHQALGHICLLTFTIILMCLFTVIINSNVGQVALLPLEQLLNLVRVRCTDIFHYTGMLEAHQQVGRELNETAIDEDIGELALLEKAVTKLAGVAKLMGKGAESKELSEHDLMLQAWMTGVHGTEDPSQGGGGRKSVHRSNSTSGSDLVDVASKAGNGQGPVGAEIVPKSLSRQSMRGNTVYNVSAGGGHGSSAAKLKLVQHLPPAPLAALSTENFDALSLDTEKKIQFGQYIILHWPGCEQLVESCVPPEVVKRFVIGCEAKYPPNPFHNFSHALDVLYSTSFSMQKIHAEMFISELSQLGLLVAALGHDLAHVGVNNNFLIETSHEVAMTYNDRSPLENLHCATLFRILSDSDANVYRNIDKTSYKEVRKGTVESILHTDIIKHNEMIKELKILYQMHSASFEESIVQSRKKGMDPWRVTTTPHSWTAAPSEEVSHVLADEPQLMLNSLLHCNDVGNPMKPWELCQRWSYLCLDEFFAQGDLEKKAGIPVQMLNDRDKVNRPNSQIGFIEFMMVPMVEAMVMIFPGLHGLAERTGTNIRRWADCWISETNPPPDQVDKVDARVDKVIARCESLTEPLKGRRGGGLRKPPDTRI